MCHHGIFIWKYNLNRREGQRSRDFKNQEGRIQPESYSLQGADWVREAFQCVCVQAGLHICMFIHERLILALTHTRHNAAHPHTHPTYMHDLTLTSML